jgi:hypothetical protein
MSTRPNAEAEWEARIAHIETAPPAPESWEVQRHHPHRLHLHDGEPWSLVEDRRDEIARVIQAAWHENRHGWLLQDIAARHIADALLPVVDAMIRQAQAEALEGAAHYLDDGDAQMVEVALGGAPYVHRVLCDRAAALRVTTDKPDVTETEKRTP